MADQASKKELKQLKAAFKDMDKDKNKKVTILELKTAMEKNGILFNRSLFDMLDQNGDGTISLDEYIKSYVGGKSGKQL